MECEKALCNQIPKYFPDFHRHLRFLKILEWRNAEALLSCLVFQKKSSSCLARSALASADSSIPRIHHHPDYLSSEHLPAMEIIWGLGFFSQNLSFPCGSIHSTWMRNMRPEAMATGMAGSCRSAYFLECWGKNRRKQEKDGSQGSLCLLPPRCSTCPGSSRASRDEGGRRVWRAQCLPVMLHVGMLHPAGSRRDWEAASSRGLGRLCLDVSSRGSGMLRPNRSSTGSRILFPDGCGMGLKRLSLDGSNVRSRMLCPDGFNTESGMLCLDGSGTGSMPLSLARSNTRPSMLCPAGSGLGLRGPAQDQRCCARLDPDQDQGCSVLLFSVTDVTEGC